MPIIRRERLPPPGGVFEHKLRLMWKCRSDGPEYLLGLIRESQRVLQTLADYMGLAKGRYSITVRHTTSDVVLHTDFIYVMIRCGPLVSPKSNVNWAKVTGQHEVPTDFSALQIEDFDNMKGLSIRFNRFNHRNV